MASTSDTLVCSTGDLFRRSRDAWTALRNEFSDFFEKGEPDVLYGLPDLLIGALRQEAPGFLAGRELQFERALTAFLRQHHSIGLVQGKLVRSSLFEVRAPVTVSTVDFEALGWKEVGLTCESVNRMCEEAESRAVHFHEQLVSYAGWLVTNPIFLGEVAALRQREPDFLAAGAGSEVAEKYVREMNAFLNRWQLAGMASWDLPEPQGPSLAGIGLPAAARRGAESVKLEFPLTTRLPAQFPIRNLIAENRRQKSHPHLSEWHEILDQDSNGGAGVQRLRYVLQLQLFRNIVLASRYADQFKGRIAALDGAFGRFLGNIGEDSVKKLRVEINRRLNSVSVKHKRSVK